VKWAMVAKKAKQMVDDRGGFEALKQDAANIKDIATGEGSIGTKAGTAARVMKERATDTSASDGDVETSTVEAAVTEPADPDTPAVPKTPPTHNPDLAAWAAGDDTAVEANSAPTDDSAAVGTPGDDSPGAA
jgi:hypothetical protein